LRYPAGTYRLSQTRRQANKLAMRLDLVLGGNVRLNRGDSSTAAHQQRIMYAAASALAQTCTCNEVAIV
jgi:hypothetical protein